VLEDPQAAALGLFAQINLTREQPIVLPRLPIGLSLTSPSPQGPPPSTGQHGRVILQEAGYSDAEIEELIRIGACGIEGDHA
jgi:crotonobetainyl-CoA:carnitine CoA-transferase CaiB-like acyl-CoA transferase